MAGRTAVLIDTGPLVASLSRGDQHHAWAAEQMGLLRGPLLTCEAVLSETSFLLTRSGLDPSLPVAAVERGALEIRPVVAAHAGRIAALMRKYADVPMSLADAALVVLAELEPGSTVFTADSDFHVYRRNERDAIPLLFPGRAS